MAFTSDINSLAPTQPPTAPAKQEHNNDNNNQTQHPMADPGDPPDRGNERSVTILPKVHFLQSLPVRPLCITRGTKKEPPHWAALIYTKCSDNHLPNRLRLLPNNQGQEQVGHNDYQSPGIFHHQKTPDATDISEIIHQLGRFVKSNYSAITSHFPSSPL